jgi:hypothetical protein
MKTLRAMVWEVFESEALSEGGYTSHGYNADELVAVVRDWYWEALDAAGIDRRLLYAAAEGVLDEIEREYWDMTRQRLRMVVRRRENRCARRRNRAAVRAAIRELCA